jgi:hypothetical protein
VDPLNPPIACLPVGRGNLTKSESRSFEIRMKKYHIFHNSLFVCSDFLILDLYSPQGGWEVEIVMGAWGVEIVMGGLEVKKQHLRQPPSLIIVNLRLMICFSEVPLILKYNFDTLSNFYTITPC